MFKIANTIKSDNKENKNQIQTSKTENINSKNMHNYNENTNIDNNKPMFFI